MKTIIVAIKDSAMQAFMNPTGVRARGQALRSFTDEVNRADPQNPLHQHPEDYELWQLATFDEETGEFQNALEILIRGKDAVKPE